MAFFKKLFGGDASKTPGNISLTPLVSSTPVALYNPQVLAYSTQMSCLASMALIGKHAAATSYKTEIQQSTAAPSVGGRSASFAQVVLLGLDYASEQIIFRIKRGGLAAEAASPSRHRVQPQQQQEQQGLDNPHDKNERWIDLQFIPGTPYLALLSDQYLRVFDVTATAVAKFSREGTKQDSGTAGYRPEETLEEGAGALDRYLRSTVPSATESSSTPTESDTPEIADRKAVESNAGGSCHLVAVVAAKTAAFSCMHVPVGSQYLFIGRTSGAIAFFSLPKFSWCEFSLSIPTMLMTASPPVSINWQTYVRLACEVYGTAPKQAAGATPPQVTSDSDDPLSLLPHAIRSLSTYASDPNSVVTHSNAAGVIKFYLLEKKFSAKFLLPPQEDGTTERVATAVAATAGGGYVLVGTEDGHIALFNELANKRKDRIVPCITMMDTRNCGCITRAACSLAVTFLSTFSMNTEVLPATEGAPSSPSSPSSPTPLLSTEEAAQAAKGREYMHHLVWANKQGELIISAMYKEKTSSSSSPSLLFLSNRTVTAPSGEQQQQQHAGRFHLLSPGGLASPPGVAPSAVFAWAATSPWCNSNSPMPACFFSLYPTPTTAEDCATGGILFNIIRRDETKKGQPLAVHQHHLNLCNDRTPPHAVSRISNRMLVLEPHCAHMSSAQSKAAAGSEPTEQLTEEILPEPQEAAPHVHTSAPSWPNSTCALLENKNGAAAVTFALVQEDEQQQPHHQHKGGNSSASSASAAPALCLQHQSPMRYYTPDNANDRPYLLLSPSACCATAQPYADTCAPCPLPRWYTLLDSCFIGSKKYSSYRVIDTHQLHRGTILLLLLHVFDMSDKKSGKKEAFASSCVVAVDMRTIQIGSIEQIPIPPSYGNTTGATCNVIPTKMCVMEAPHVLEPIRSAEQQKSSQSSDGENLTDDPNAQWHYANYLGLLTESHGVLVYSLTSHSYVAEYPAFAFFRQGVSALSIDYVRCSAKAVGLKHPASQTHSPSSSHSAFAQHLLLFVGMSDGTVLVLDITRRSLVTCLKLVHGIASTSAGKGSVATATTTPTTATSGVLHILAERLERHIDDVFETTDTESIIEAFASVSSIRGTPTTSTNTVDSAAFSEEERSKLALTTASFFNAYADTAFAAQTQKKPQKGQNNATTAIATADARLLSSMDCVADFNDVVMASVPHEPFAVPKSAGFRLVFKRSLQLFNMDREEVVHFTQRMLRQASVLQAAMMPNENGEVPPTIDDPLEDAVSERVSLHTWSGSVAYELAFIYCRGVVAAQLRVHEGYDNQQQQQEAAVTAWTIVNAVSFGNEYGLHSDLKYKGDGEENAAAEGEEKKKEEKQQEKSPLLPLSSDQVECYGLQAQVDIESGLFTLTAMVDSVPLPEDSEAAHVVIDDVDIQIPPSSHDRRARTYPSGHHGILRKGTCAQQWHKTKKTQQQQEQGFVPSSLSPNVVCSGVSITHTHPYATKAFQAAKTGKAASSLASSVSRVFVKAKYQQRSINDDIFFMQRGLFSDAAIIHGISLEALLFVDPGSAYRSSCDNTNEVDEEPEKKSFREGSQAYYLPLYYRLLAVDDPRALRDVVPQRKLVSLVGPCVAFVVRQSVNKSVTDLDGGIQVHGMKVSDMLQGISPSGSAVGETQSVSTHAKLKFDSNEQFFAQLFSPNLCEYYGIDHLSSVGNSSYLSNSATVQAVALCGVPPSISRVLLCDTSSGAEKNEQTSSARPSVSPLYASNVDTLLITVACIHSLHHNTQERALIPVLVITDGREVSKLVCITTLYDLSLLLHAYQDRTTSNVKKTPPFAFSVAARWICDQLHVYVSCHVNVCPQTWTTHCVFQPEEGSLALGDSVRRLFTYLSWQTADGPKKLELFDRVSQMQLSLNAQQGAGEGTPSHVKLRVFPKADIGIDSAQQRPQQRHVDPQQQQATAVPSTAATTKSASLLKVLPPLPGEVSSSLQKERGLLKRLTTSNFGDQLKKVEDKLAPTLQLAPPPQQLSERDALLTRTAGDKKEPSSTKQPSKTEATKGAVADTKNVMSENMDKLKERGERIQRLDEKTTEMENEATEFADLCRQLKEKQKKSSF